MQIISIYFFVQTEVSVNISTSEESYYYSNDDYE